MQLRYPSHGPAAAADPIRIGLFTKLDPPLIPSDPVDGLTTSRQTRPVRRADPLAAMLFPPPPSSFGYLRRHQLFARETLVAILQRQLVGIPGVQRRAPVPTRHAGLPRVQGLIRDFHRDQNADVIVTLKGRTVLVTAPARVRQQLVAPTHLERALPCRTQHLRGAPVTSPAAGSDRLLLRRCCGV